jgi:hypothetical protein
MPALKMPAMAKKATDSSEALLSPDFRRRHPHLILPKLVTDKAGKIFFDETRLKSGLAVLKQWGELAAQGALSYTDGWVIGGSQS